MNNNNYDIGRDNPASSKKDDITEGRSKNKVTPENSKTLPQKGDEMCWHSAITA